MAEILRVYELIELHSHLEDILLNMQTIVVHRLRIKIKKLGLQKRFATTSSEENTKKILFSVKIGKKNSYVLNEIIIGK